MTAPGPDGGRAGGGGKPVAFAALAGWAAGMLTPPVAAATVAAAVGAAWPTFGDAAGLVCVASGVAAALSPIGLLGTAAALEWHERAAPGWPAWRTAAAGGYGAAVAAWLSVAAVLTLAAFAGP